MPAPPDEGFRTQELLGEPKYLHVDELPVISG